MTRFQVCKSLIVALSACVVLALASLPSEAQFLPGRAPKASVLLQQGRDAFSHGEFEKAAKLYEQAQQNQQQLSARERSDLLNLMGQNDTALKAQRHGREQLTQAKVSLDKGLTSQAAALLQAAGTNQYLSVADKQLLGQLSARLQPSELADPVAKMDYSTLMKEARSALKRGDLDTAEYMANQAEKTNSGILPSWVQPWNDSPTKVLREVKLARASNEQANNSAQPAGGVPPNPNMGKMLGWQANSSPKNDQPPTMPEYATNKTPMPGQPGLMKTGFTGEPVKNDAATEKARQMVKAGYQALHQGDLNRARSLAEQARALNHNLQWFEDNPQKLLTDIDRQAPLAANPKNPGGMGNPPLANVDTSKMTPAQLLQYARDLYKQGQFDEADHVCNQAATAPGANWGLFTDSPTKLRNDIKAERSKQDRQMAVKVLAQARTLYTQGMYKEAKDLTYQAEKLYGTYSIFDLGDRPDKLRKEIIAAELTNKKTEGPVPPDLAGGFPPPPGAGMMPLPGIGGTQSPIIPVGGTNTDMMLARQKTVELLKQARQLQASKQLVEAYAKAMEAKQAAITARKLGVLFGPTEDSPEQLLLQLSQECRNNINQMMAQVDQVVANTKDANRIQKAGALLHQADNLARTFGLPTMEIDAKAVWLGQMAKSGPAFPPIGQMPVGPAVPPPLAGGDNQKQGNRLIEDAMRELKAGQTLLARKIAEEAINPKYGVQKQAAALLRDITLEEIEQKKLSSVRNFEAMRDLLILGKVDQARTIAGSIDPMLLPLDKQKHFTELLMTIPQSGNGQLAATQPKKGGSELEFPGQGSAKVSVTDNFPGVGGPGEADFEKIKVMEAVLFDKLKKEGLAVQIKARDAFKAGNHSQSLELLREFQDQLTEAKLAPGRVKLLQQPIAKRIEEYKVLKAQIDWEKETKIALGKGPYAAEQERMDGQKKRDQKIQELLKECQALYRDKKFEQAKMLAMQARDLDKDNIAAQMALQMATMASNKDKFHKNEDEKADYFIEELNMGPGKHLSLNNPLSLNKGILEKSRGRDKNTGKGYKYDPRTEIEKGIERKLDSFITLSFKDTALKDAIVDLKKISGLNIVPDTSALADASVNQDTLVTLDVENIPMRSALNILLKKVNLTYVIKDDVLQITTEAEARGKLVQVTYPVADLVIPVVDAKRSEMATLADLLTSYGANNPYTHAAPYMQPGMPTGAPVSSYGNPGAGGFAQNHPGSSTPSLSGGSWTMAQKSRETIEGQLIKLITSTIKPDSWSELGGKGTIQYFPLGMGMVVNQTLDIQEQIADLLQALRRLQDLEVAIEIRLISVSESFFEYIGLDFDLNITTNQGRFEPQVVSQVFQPGGFVNRFLPDGFLSGLTPAGTFTPDLNIPIRSSSSSFNIPQVGGFPGALGANGGLALGLAFLSDIQVFMFLEAAQGDRRANAMQAPRVTVFNGQFATLQVTDTLPFLTNIQPNNNINPTFFIPTQIPLQFGTFISVQPVVTADRRFVRLAIQQQLTNLVSTNVPLIPIQIPVFDQVFGGTPSNQPKVFQIFLQQPAQSLISVNTTVTVPDGGTVLLGGLKTLTEMRSEFGPPVLSKIPYISRLFKNVGYGREATSLLMMVTPRIIINEEEELIYLEQLPPIPRP